MCESTGRSLFTFATAHLPDMSRRRIPAWPGFIWSKFGPVSNQGPFSPPILTRTLAFRRGCHWDLENYKTLRTQTSNSSAAVRLNILFPFTSFFGLVPFFSTPLP